MRALRILIAVVLLFAAVAYLLFWTTAYRQMLRLPALPHSPTTHTELSADAPVLHAALWLLRIDYFAPQDTSAGVPLGALTEFRTAGHYHCGLAVAAGLAGCALLLSCARAGRRRWIPGLGAGLAGFASVALAGVLAYGLTTRTRHVPAWDRKPVQDVLSGYLRAGKVPRAMYLPEGEGEPVPPRDDVRDLNIAVDAEGRASVAGIPTASLQLSRLLRDAAMGAKLRVLLWIDERCPTERCTAVSSLAYAASAERVYRVVKDAQNRLRGIAVDPPPAPVEPRPVPGAELEPLPAPDAGGAPAPPPGAGT